MVASTPRQYHPKLSNYVKYYLFHACMDYHMNSFDVISQCRRIITVIDDDSIHSLVTSNPHRTVRTFVMHQ